MALEEHPSLDEYIGNEGHIWSRVGPLELPPSPGIMVLGTGGAYLLAEAPSC